MGMHGEIPGNFGFNHCWDLVKSVMKDDLISNGVYRE
jgi:hypothetical protein